MAATKKNFKGKIEFALIVLPVISMTLFAFYIPFIMSMAYSLTNWNGISRKPVFIGLQNFQDILGDFDFGRSVVFTAKYALFYIVIVNVLAIFLALMLEKKLRSRNFLRAALFVPYILSMIIVGYIWRFIFLQGFDSLHKLTGLPFWQLSWLGDAKLAFISVLVVSIWQTVGFYIVIYIAGLQTIPPELTEAAAVDGAGYFRRFIHITIPMLMPAVTICVFLSLTNAIKIFDFLLSLTAGGPGGSTTSVTYNIFKDAFTNNMYGYGTAKALVLYIAILAVTFVQIRIFKSREVEA